MSLPENQNPKPDLEEDEFIDSFTLPLASLYDGLRKLEAEGYAIDSRIGAIAEGIEMAKKLNFAWCPWLMLGIFWVRHSSLCN